ncbi:hypothetical protein [Aliterella atlantica]|uniref:Uncharacterized protein n=1 Tax=Aliterella atlantica CENA595 TaxID=1618023 RepID=A0A0D8ZKY2_9CYAN|nr:hypothetical protein [Aliterella atlantica]KJH69390.1 hypothetical protein UH38_24105 [Aliterella atlantica CENA595]
MQIKTVHYSALLNLGNYSNEKIGFTAQLSEGESVEQVIEQLREKVKQNGGTNAEELYQTMYRGRRELAELERKIKNATDQWNATAEFLRAQGIKPDTGNMPQFTNLLPEIKEEDSGVVDGEIEEELEVESSDF